MIDFAGLVERVCGEVAPIAQRGGDWQHPVLAEAASIGEPEAFLAWARDHRQWRFAVAEAAGEVCAKPREAAAHVLVKIVGELLEERGVPATD